MNVHCNMGANCGAQVPCWLCLFSIACLSIVIALPCSISIYPSAAQLWSTSVVLVTLLSVACLSVVIVLLWFISIYLSVIHLHVCCVPQAHCIPTRANSLELDLPNGRWQIKVQAFGLHLVLSPRVGCDPEGWMWLFFIHSFIHSFIYFSFRQSIQGHRQPTGYRTCHTANAI